MKKIISIFITLGLILSACDERKEIMERDSKSEIIASGDQNFESLSGNSIMIFYDQNFKSSYKTEIVENAKKKGNESEQNEVKYEKDDKTDGNIGLLSSFLSITDNNKIIVCPLYIIIASLTSFMFLSLLCQGNISFEDLLKEE
jgi:hypothetical protein